MQSDGAAELFNHCCSLCCFRAFKTARLLARLDSDLVPGAASDAAWFWGGSAHCVAMSRGESARCVVMLWGESARGVAMLRGNSAHCVVWGKSAHNSAILRSESSKSVSAHIAASWQKSARAALSWGKCAESVASNAVISCGHSALTNG